MKKLPDRHLSKLNPRFAIIIWVTVGFYSINVLGQTLTERVILSDTRDSILLNAESVNFDLNGDYSFEVKDKDGFAIITKLGKTQSLVREHGGTVSQFASKVDRTQKFYRCSSTKLFGPLIGTQIEGVKYPVSQNSKHVAIPCRIRDSIAIYIDGELKMKIDTSSRRAVWIGTRKASPYEAKKSRFNSDDWLDFSNNGNCIYSVENDSLNRLFVNGKQIDSSESEFYQLRINDNGDYIYSKGRRPLLGENNKYAFMFFLHTKDTVLGHVRTVWEVDLKNNGAYYYSGDDNGTYYIAINNTLQKRLKSVSNITLIDKTNYLFTYTENDVNKINVNGKVFEHSYEDVCCFSLDRHGNYAFYGKKDYYIYKYVNGRQNPNPISKYEVRATPLFVSPTGASLHYFKTDDSTYLYQDDTLLFNAISNATNFNIQPFSELIPYVSYRRNVNNVNSILYLEIDTVGYIVFNGAFSSPMKGVTKPSWTREKQVGEIVAGRIEDHGFFAIQKTGDSDYVININNVVFKAIDGVQKILVDSCYFENGTLVFYAIKGLSFIQYTLVI